MREQPTIIDVRRAPTGALLTCSAAGRMERSEFERYLTATRAADYPYDPNLNMQVGKPEDFAALVKGLREAGFRPRIDAAVKTVLSGMATELNARAAASNALAAASAAEFAARGLRLYPFQETGATFLRERKGGALLADQMGLGKTIQALAALPTGVRCIVVAPAAVKGVWRYEASVWRPDLKPTVLKGRAGFRVPDVSEMAIINYEMLPIDPPTDLPAGLVLIVDEVHMAKGRATARTKRLRKLATAVMAQGGKVWMLTGTPLLNRSDELWNVLDNCGLAREAFGSFKRFALLFEAAHDAETAFGATTEFAACLRKVSLMRRRNDVLPDLPKKTYGQVWFEDLDDATKAALDRLETILKECGYFDRVQDALDEVRRDLGTPEVVAQYDDMDEDGAPRRARRIPFEEIARIRALVATAKIPTMLATVEEYEAAEEPLVVFSAHKAPAEAAGKRPGWALITGDTSPEKRTEIVADFQAGKLKGVALTIRAGGTGLTLTHACTTLFVDLEWTPALNAQAEDRVCRIGQSRPVVVKQIVAAHPIDERLAELLQVKDGYVATVETSAVQPDTDTAKLLKTKGDALAALLATVEVATETSRLTPAAPAADEKWASIVIRDRVVKVLVRGARNDEEKWTADALLTLSACDGDRARERNEAGFNKIDTGFGNSLAEQLRENGGLTDGQWRAARNLVWRYPAQVGRPKTETGVLS